MAQLYEKNSASVNLYCFSPGEHDGCNTKRRENNSMALFDGMTTATGRLVTLALVFVAPQYAQRVTAAERQAMADIGLTRADARREGDKPFWRG
ncbi:hypothetical protein M8494_18445 [Serratia ureilytica]